jgi:hypothetical protein
VDEPVEGLGAFWGPVKRRILLQKASEGFGDVRKPGNEGALESKDAKSASYLFDGFKRPWPFFDPSDF